MFSTIKFVFRFYIIVGFSLWTFFFFHSWWLWGKLFSFKFDVCYEDVIYKCLPFILYEFSILRMEVLYVVKMKFHTQLMDAWNLLTRYKWSRACLSRSVRTLFLPFLHYKFFINIRDNSRDFVIFFFISSLENKKLINLQQAIDIILWRLKYSLCCG